DDWTEPGPCRELAHRAGFRFVEYPGAYHDFDAPNTPLRVTIGRTYEWYEAMGEFEGVKQELDEHGTCKYCGRVRYCQWPPRVSTQPVEATHHESPA
ncbi:MAG: hypothetical protein HY870_12815, partial [Chloroflexi bacterium]|nr:hypothetical protein [Chloroflexota bacterium]